MHRLKTALALLGLVLEQWTLTAGLITAMATASMLMHKLTENIKLRITKAFQLKHHQNGHPMEMQECLMGEHHVSADPLTDFLKVCPRPSSRHYNPRQALNWSQDALLPRLHANPKLLTAFS